MPRTACTVRLSSRPTAKSLVSASVRITVLLSECGACVGNDSAPGSGQVRSSTACDAGAMLETSGRSSRLLSSLQARRDWPGATLAERSEVSPRTVRRDVDRSRTSGYPVRATKGPDGGYRLDAGADVPPLSFDDEQAVAVAVASRTGASPGVEDAAARALATIRQVMPARSRARIDASEVTAVPGRREQELPTVRPDVLVAVGTAATERRVLRFDYDGGTGEVSRAPGAPEGAGFRAPRRAEPHHLATWGGRWYLVAWDLDREDWRTFRVDRMVPREGTGARFAPRASPAPDVATFVAERFATTSYPVRGTVELHADAATVARWAGADAVVEPAGEGRCRSTTGSWSWGGLAARCAMFDVPFDVVGPPESRDAVRVSGERARAAARGEPGHEGARRNRHHGTALRSRCEVAGPSGETPTRFLGAQCCPVSAVRVSGSGAFSNGNPVFTGPGRTAGSGRIQNEGSAPRKGLGNEVGGG
ncbi:hypothetical protein OY671_002774, partial [Metschnikowia pulcherrima]